MKKLITCFLTVFMLLALPALAGAEKEKYKNEDYDFSTVKVVKLEGITSQTPARANFRSDDALEDKVYTALEAALSKRNVNLAVNAMHGTPKLKIKVIVHALGTYLEHKPAYDATETVNKKEVGKDEHGNDVVVTVPTQETVHHPAEDISHAVAELEFMATDFRSHKQVYTVTDSRERASETDTSGMLHRICSDFARDITRN